MSGDNIKRPRQQKGHSMYRWAGAVWFFICAVGGAYILDYLVRTYPMIVGPLLPAALVLLLGVIVGGRVLITRIIEHSDDTRLKRSSYPRLITESAPHYLLFGTSILMEAGGTIIKAYETVRTDHLTNLVNNPEAPDASTNIIGPNKYIAA